MQPGPIIRTRRAQKKQISQARPRWESTKIVATSSSQIRSAGGSLSACWVKTGLVPTFAGETHTTAEAAGPSWHRWVIKGLGQACSPQLMEIQEACLAQLLLTKSRALDWAQRDLGTPASLGVQNTAPPVPRATLTAVPATAKSPAGASGKNSDRHLFYAAFWDKIS